MSLRSLLTAPLKKVLKNQGYVLRREDEFPVRWTMDGALESLSSRGVVVNTVVDIGASNGSWAAPCMKYFPEASYLLIEAQELHREKLEEFTRTHPSTMMVLAAAGRERGTIYFDVNDPEGGQASYTPFEKANAVVPVTTVDFEVQRLGLNSPFLLKFDTHGFEVPILEGAKETLRVTSAIVMECYNFKIAPEALLFYEMCEYLGKFGFRPIDVVEPRHRLYDDAFWQMDIAFVKEDRPEFGYKAYR